MNKNTNSIKALTLAFIMLLSLFPFNAVFAQSTNGNSICVADSLIAGSSYYLGNNERAIVPHITQNGGLSAKLIENITPISQFIYTNNGHFYNEHENAFLARAGNVLLLAKQEKYALSAQIHNGHIVFSANGTESIIEYNANNDAFLLSTNNISREIIAFSSIDKDIDNNRSYKDSVPVTGIVSAETALELVLHTDTAQQSLEYSVEPDTATNKNVSFQSADTSVATVADGIVTAVSPGTTQVTATTEDGGFSCEYRISVILPTYSVRFFGADMQTVISEQTVVHGQSATAPTAQTLMGHTFSDWTCDFSCVTSALDVYPIYSLDEYEISYFTNGGWFASPPVYTYSYESESIALPTPLRTGYGFAGWYVNSELIGDTVTEIPSGSIGDKCFYASWSIAQYTIAYATDGGSFSTEPITTYTMFDNDIQLPIPERAGYAFLGWYDNSNLFGSVITVIPSGSSGDVQFFAAWEAIDYSISYTTNGGSFSETPVSEYTIESEVIILPIPTKIGYTFAGWFDNEQLTGNVIAEIASGSTGNVQLFAGWTAVTYAITYIANGGTFSDSPAETYTIESADIVLPTPQKAGYDFIGWFDNPSFDGGLHSAIASGSYGDKTYYACYSVITYSITYETNGGTITGLAPSTYTVESPTIVLPAVAKRGYSFIGWYSTASFLGLPVAVIANGSVGDRSFFARFEYIEYSIVYEANGGALPQNSPSGYNVESSTITLPTPVRTGYDFIGWYDNSEYVGSAIAQIPSGSIGDLVLYAKWSATVYSITYIANGGSIAIGSPTTFTIESGRIVLVTPTRRGYSFSGWYDNPSFLGDSVSIIAAGSIGNRTYYAKWSIITYSITYVVNGGTIPLLPRSYTVESESITLTAATRVGYTFSGWFENSQFLGSPVTSIEKGSIGNKTLHAKWVPVVYSIAYVLNGGTLPYNSVLEYTTESPAITLLTPSKRGYLFAGWYDNASFIGASIQTIPSGSTGNRTYYAQWTLIYYSITYETNGGTMPNGYATSFSIESSEIILPTPTKAGYSFRGWYANPTLSGDRIINIANGSIGSRTYYAAYDIVTYVIQYNTNHGELPENAVYSYNVESQTITLPIPTRPGYTFVGWYTNANLTGAMLTQIVSGSIGDLTLYAAWRAIIYTIEYVTNGGVFPGDVLTQYTVESETIYLTVPSRNGYTFMGWYINQNLSGPNITIIPSGTIGNIRVYAAWEIITYTITYHYYEGIMPEVYDVTYTVESDTVVLPRPTQVGHVFVGWYANEDFSGVPIREIETGSFGNVVLYANWRRHVYTVNFYDMDREALLASVRADYGTAAVAPTPPSHYGLTFARWSDDISFISQSIDVYAIYETAVYDVVFVDIDYTVLLTQRVEHGSAATPPTPPVHEGSIFVFWSTDFSCVTSNLTVVAVYRATSVTPPVTDTDRFVPVDEFEEGEEYAIVARNGEGEAFALSSLERLTGNGLWGLPVSISQYSIFADAGTIDDALFTVYGANFIGYHIESVTSGEELFCKDGYFTMDNLEDNGDLFTYQYQNGAWRLYDKTQGTYLSFNAEGYFETAELENASKIELYKHINMNADYVAISTVRAYGLYTFIAVRPDGRAFALSSVTTEGGLLGYEVRIINNKIYFNDNIDEREVAFRIAAMDDKGLYLRNAKTGLYLGIDDNGILTASDSAADSELWRFGEHEDSLLAALQENMSGKYVFCSSDGVFAVKNTITHSEIRSYERIADYGRVCDVNFDGKVNSGDATLLLRHIVGIIDLHENENFNILDGNGDNKVNTGDATLILRYVVGIVDWLK